MSKTKSHCYLTKQKWKREGARGGKITNPERGSSKGCHFSTEQSAWKEDPGKQGRESSGWTAYAWCPHSGLLGMNWDNAFKFASIVDLASMDHQIQACKDLCHWELTRLEPPGIEPENADPHVVWMVFLFCLSVFNSPFCMLQTRHPGIIPMGWVQAEIDGLFLI